MEKKKYIAPLTETSLVTIENHMMVTSYEEGIDPGHSDAKEINFDDFNSEEDIWSGHQTKDAWER